MPSQRIDFGKLASVFAPHGATATPDVVQQSADAAVQDRCSLQALRKRTAELTADAELGETLKNRWLHWVDVENASDQAAAAADADDDDLPKKARKRKRKTPEPLDLVESPEALQKREDFEARLPNAFRFHDRAAQMTAYADRESRLDSNVMAQATPAHLVYAKPAVITAPPDVVQDSILRITIYSRPVAGRGKNSQQPGAMLPNAHEDLSSPSTRTQELEIRADQTLADLRHAFVCRFDDMPARDGGTHGSATLQEGVSFTGKKRTTDSVFGIEGKLYGENAASPECYARLIAASASRARQEGTVESGQSLPQHMVDSGKRMRDVRLQDLRLRTGQHYWFLHQGSCEHAWEITSVRAPHVTDVPVTAGGAGDPNQVQHPRITYLTTEVLMRPIVRYERVFAPPETYTLTKCSICARRPSRMLVVGGARVGESSAAPADDQQGQSSKATQVAVVGLPEQQSPICEACWTLVAPEPTEDGPGPLPTPPEFPPAAVPVDGAFAEASKERWARAGGPSWAVVPLLD